jgi:hypothetical protein
VFSTSGGNLMGLCVRAGPSFVSGFTMDARATVTFYS